MSGLDLAVDRESEVPLGTQLSWKLRTLIAAGKLSPGDRLPGIREVAQAAGVNVNTVRSVFSRLEEQSLLVTKQGRGTYVADDAQPAVVLGQMASSALAQARKAGIDPRELAAALYVNSPSRPPSPHHAGDDQREARLAVRGEIIRLEREVAALDPLGPLETAVPGRTTDGPAPRLLTLAELRQTRDRLTARVQELRAERASWLREAEERQRAEAQYPEQRPAREPHWRKAGIWTGHPRARVSFTSP